MIKNLLLAVTLVSTGFTYGQYSEGFESFTETIGNNSGFTTQSIHEVVANPHKTGINTSDNVFKTTQVTGSKLWDWAFWLNANIQLTEANGRYLKMKILSENETNVTVSLIPWIASTKGDAGTDNDRERTYTVTVPLNTWTEVEFYYGDITPFPADPAHANRIGIAFNRAIARDGDVFYADDIEQSTVATLSASSPSFKNVGVYPNPTTGTINISDISNIPGDISISNVLGQVVKTVKAANTITISDLPQGIYFLQTGNQLIKKVIKK